MEIIDQNINEIAKIFGYGYNESFFSYLKTISKPNNQVCNKRIPKGEGGWKCLDCEIDALSLICNNCFSKAKDKHIGHKISFDPGNYGFCDCGDPNVLIQEGFCPDHQGGFTNMKDLFNFIKLSFDEKILNIINSYLNNIFNKLIEEIRIVLNMNLDEEGYQKKEDELFNMISKFVSFISKLYESNLGLFYFVTLKFTENFPFETKHKCFNYNEEKNLIITISESSLEVHKCICPFFQVLINVLMLRKTEFDSDNFFSLFVQNYKNKLITGLSFMHSFIKLYSNNNLMTFRGMSYQLLSDHLTEVVYEENNIYFLENFFFKFYLEINELLGLRLYQIIDEIISRLYEIIKYLPKLQMLDKIKSKLKIHGIIIDIICLINNSNTFEDKTKFNAFQREGFNINLLNCEMYSLLIASLLSYLIDYNDLNSVKFIFNKIISKLYEYKNYKNNLKEKIYTPHITYIRYYSIFLNRFCFHYSINNNCDLLDSFQYFQELFPQTKELNSFLFKELITFFGFFISQKYSFFIYYGEGMIMYYKNYFSSRIYINCDITLMKYLLTTSEIQNEFNIYNILSYSSIDSSNDFFLNLKDTYLFEKNEALIQMIKLEEKNLKYINSILEFVLQIIRNDMAMINLSFKYSDSFRMKFSDTLFDKLLQNEKENIENMIKNQIIHLILGHKNVVEREDCMKFYNEYTSLNKNLDVNLVDNLLKENCFTMNSTNQLKIFTLQNNAFKYCDIDYIIDCSQRKNAIQYILDFRSDSHNILNTYISNSLTVQKRLNNRIYETIFNNKNLENMLQFYNAIISNNNYILFSDIFFTTISKYICTYIKVKEQNTNEEYKNKILDIINSNKLESINHQYFKYIKQLLANEDTINENKSKLKISKNLKDKYKKKYEERNKKVLDKLSSSEIITKSEENDISSSKIKEICIYCRQPLNYEDLNNYYGKICFLIRDYFIDIINNKEEKLRTKTTRIVTCNHKIHFNCFSEFTVKNIKEDENFLKEGFKCPLCKKLSNIMICDFKYLIETNNNIIKGIPLKNQNQNNIIYGDESDNYQNFIIYNKNFFEIYCSKLLKKEIVINDINGSLNLFESLYNSLIKDFGSFIIYYNITNYKKEQISIWKNILYTIRILSKFKGFNWTEFFILKFNSLYLQFKNFEFPGINNNNNYEEISSIIHQFIFCLFIIFDFNEEDIHDFFQNYILEYLFAFYCIKSNKNNLKEFLCESSNQYLLKKIFNLYSQKYKICLLLFNENKEINIDFEETIKFLKGKENQKYKLINNSTDILIKEKELGGFLFNIIELPENFMEFCSKYMNINCKNCDKKNLNYYICLICGSKICDDKRCVSEYHNGNKEYSLIVHSKKCGGGNVLFISNLNSQIIYLLKRQFTNSGIYVYLNSFGEYIKSYYSNDKYILNQVELKKGIHKFIDITFRMKGKKTKL